MASKRRAIYYFKGHPPWETSHFTTYLKKCPPVKLMKDSVKKLKIRMSTSERDWWENMIKDEEEKVTQWASLTEKDYGLAGRRLTF